MTRTATCAACLVGAWLAWFSAPAGAVDYRVLAAQGELAPGFVLEGGDDLGDRFGHLDEMTFSINSSGHVAFGASLADSLFIGACDWLNNRTAIWMDTGTGPRLIRVTPDSAPAVSPISGINYLDDPVLDDDDHLTYYGVVSGGLPYCVEEAQWRQTGDVSTPLAIGDVTPAWPPDVLLAGNVRAAYGAAASRGRIVLWSDTVDSTGARHGHVLLLAEPGHDPQVIARSDIPVPGSSSVRLGLPVVYVSLNEFGHTAFTAPLVELPTNLGPNSSIWRTDPTGNLQAVAIRDNAPPDILGERFLFIADYQTPRIDNAGDVLFYAERGPQNGYWLGRVGGAAELFHGTGESLAGLPTGSTLLIPRQSLCVNYNSSLCGAFDRSPAGQSAFVAQADLTASGGGVMPGVWRDLGTGLQLAALAGQPAPGYPPGTTFVEFQHLDIDDSGQLAFVAHVAGASVTEATATGVWVLPPDGPLEFRAALQGPGALVDVGAGDLWVAGNFLRIQVSASGTTAYLVEFDNGLAGLLVTVPEPATWLLAAVGGMAALLQVRRRGDSVRNQHRRADENA